jgi:uncharacterized protein
MKKSHILFLIISLLAISPSLFSIQVPELTGQVNDYAGVLSASQKAELERLLKETETKTSTQVVLLTITSLSGEALEDFSLRVVEKWKLGQEGIDNGVLLLVAMAERKVRIEVGYGLESLLTDAKSGYIIRKHIVEYFKKGDYFAGIKSGLAAITGIINKDFDITPEQLAKFRKQEKNSKGDQLPVGLIVLIIIILLSFFKKGGRGRGYRSGAPWIFLGGGLGGGRSSGGSFGGGFSGGGGSFGGGGSSGGW